MTPEEFMNLPMKEKLKTVNKMLKKEQKDHLKNVSEKIGIPYNTFTKMMRDNGNFQFNQTTKKYEKLLSLEEYEKFLEMNGNTLDENKSNEAIQFLEEHLEEIKCLLSNYQNQLILDPKVYNPTSKTITKTFQVNADIYNQFSDLCTTQFPHLRQKDIVSMCLLEFTKKYQKAPSV